MSLELQDKIILVTGAGRGIGQATVLAAADAGAQVIAVARTATDLEAVKSANPERIETWQIDVTDQRFLDKIEQLDRLDGLFNNAGTNQPQAFLDVTEAALDTMIGLNVRAMFLTAQSAARVMHRNKSGVIVNMSSQLGHVGCSGRTVYCMTKHAVEGMTKAMAVEMAAEGVRVNSISPTFIETPLTKPMLQDEGFQQSVVGRIPMGRIGQVGEIASGVVFLLSDKSSLMTGTSLVMDGGWTAQ